jgi:hemerythrin HHE cation binding domain-containing protein
MEPTATISTPFGAVPALPAEPQRLDTTLRRVGELCQALDAGRGDVEPVALFSQLRVDLELHFALEEANSYFGVVLRERPSLSQPISRLRHEHAALLEKLEALRLIVGDPLRWAELSRPTAELVDAFRKHEHEEAELMQEFFLRDDGVGAD